MRNMLKKSLALLLCLVMCLSLFPTAAFADAEIAEDLIAEDSIVEEPVVEKPVAEEPVVEEPVAEEPVVEEPVVEEPVVEEPVVEELVVEHPSEPVYPADDQEVPAEVPSVDVDAVKADPVRVVFACDPKGLVLTVYTLGENGEKQITEPDNDGSYLLAPGAYFYDAACAGYVSVEKEELLVESSAEPLRVELHLAPVVEAATPVILPESEEEPDGDELEAVSEPVDGLQETVASGSCGDNLTWTLDDQGTLTISGTGAVNDYRYNTMPWYSFRNEILKVVAESGVTSIGTNAFYDCTVLSTVILPDGVTRIESYAFYGCKELTAIDLPDSLAYIGNYAFENCEALTEITIPAGLTSVGTNGPFCRSGLQTVHFAEGVAKLPDSLFESCQALTKIVIPYGVTIDADVFRNCTALIEVGLPEGLASIGNTTFYNCTALTTISLPSSLTSIGSEAFNGCKALAEINLPSSLTSIGSYAFTNCEALTEITIPANLSSAGGNGPFRGSALRTVHFAEGVSTLPDSLLEGCTTLVSIVVPSGASIASDVFRDCTALAEVTLPDNLNSIGSSAFYNCKALTAINLPAGLTSIGSYAFTNCEALTEITIPASLSSAGGNGPFRGSGLQTVHFAEGVSTLPDSLLEGCTALVSIVIPSGASIASDVFRDCTALNEVTLPDDLSSIGSSAFYNCRALAAIDLPDSLTSIGSYAFTNCEALTEVTIPASLTSAGGNGPFNGGGLRTVHFAEGVSALPDNLFQGCTALTEIVLPEGVTSIGVSAFFDCTALAKVTLPDDLSSIGGYAFYNCKALAAIDLPDSLISIGSYAFTNCEVLTEITIPASLTSVGGNGPFNGSELRTVHFAEGRSALPDNLFQGCTALTEIVLPEEITSIGVSAFIDCTALVRVTLPDDLSSIGGYAFYNCKALDAIDLPDSLMSIGSYAFSYCEALTEITIPVNLTSVGGNGIFRGSGLRSVHFAEGVSAVINNLFEGCETLTEIVLPEGITSIGSDAFSGCTELAEIEFPKNFTSIGSYAFYNCKALRELRLPQSLTRIESYAFDNCEALSVIDLPAGLTYIGSRAFTNCVALTEITIPASLISVGMGGPFRGSGLQTVSFADGVSTVPNNLFEGCTAMTEIVLPEGITTIGEYAFYECTTLTSLYLPASLTGIGRSAFELCGALTDIFYAGDAAAWTAIAIGRDNEPLQNKEIHFGVQIPDRQAPIAVITHGELVLDLRDSIALDASESTDNVGIMTYAWDFGDGSGASAIETSHSYAAAGTYTVNLTVTDFSGNRADASVTVQVVDVDSAESGFTKLVFEICDSVSLAKIRDAQISVETGDGPRALVTDGSGQAAVILPNGGYDVSVCANNYFARTVSVQAGGGVQNCRIGLNSGSIMTGSVTVTEMTLDEIIEAGIDTENEDNQHVYKYAAILTFVAGIKDYDFPYYVCKNDAGEIVGRSEGRIHVEPGTSGGFGGWDIMIYPLTEKFVLVIYGEAHWLKEMYQAELIVNNNSNTDELLDVTASISLPEGMSLAAMAGSQQSATQNLGTIGYSGSASAKWYLRGDKEGDYNISVDVSATTSLGDQLNATYTTASPVHVYAGSALHMHIIADDIAERGKDYTVVFRLENVSTKSLYGLSFGITAMEQFKVIGYGEQEAWLPLDSADYGEAFTREVPELAPGGYIELALSTTIWFNSALELIAFTEVGSFVDVAYYLTDVTLVTLGGSTTEIPYSYELKHVERDHIISKIIKEIYGQLYPDADVSYTLGGTFIELIGEALGADEPLIKGAKTLLKLQKGETDSRLTISIDDGRGTADSIYNDVVRITTGTPGEGVIDTLNGTKIKCDPGEGKWLSIEARGPGSTRIKVAIEDDYGRSKREYSFDIVVEDREVAQKLTVTPDETTLKTTINENVFTETIRRIRAEESSTYESNPYMWFDSTLAFEITGKTSDSNFSLSITEKQLKDLTDKTAVTNIKVEGEAAGINFPREVLEKYAADNDTECTVYARRLSDEENAELGFEGKTYQFMLTHGSETVDSFQGQYVYITLPYELKENESADDLYIQHIKADGTIEELEAVYDSSGKTISFKTGGFSYFRIAHRNEAASGWKEIDGKKYYCDEDGNPVTGWKQIDGKWYIFAGDGVMKTGWVKSGSSWYYMNAEGVMVTGWQKVGSTWYYFKSSGAMVTGWQKVGSTWYYFKSSGAMVTGWQKVSSTWYYFKSSGAMVTGWQKVGSTWYYFQSSGAMKTGWVKSGGKWYYMDSSGAMLASTSRNMGGKVYYFNASGVCTNP